VLVSCVPSVILLDSFYRRLVMSQTTPPNMCKGLYEWLKAKFLPLVAVKCQGKIINQFNDFAVSLVRISSYHDFALHESLGSSEGGKVGS
jgi:hypothetical protein